MVKKKNVKSKTKTSFIPKYYTKFKRVHLASNGIFTLCKATTVEGIEEYFQWDRKEHRDLVRNNVTDDVQVIAENNVTKGWDYD